MGWPDGPAYLVEVPVRFGWLEYVGICCNYKYDDVSIDVSKDYQYVTGKSRSSVWP